MKRRSFFKSLAVLLAAPKSILAAVKAVKPKMSHLMFWKQTECQCRVVTDDYRKCCLEALATNTWFGENYRKVVNELARDRIYKGLKFSHENHLSQQQNELPTTHSRAVSSAV